MIERKKNFLVSLRQYILISVYAILTAFSYVIFVFPNDFAPAGLNGFATMIQYMVGLDIMGEISLLINLPLLAVAFFVLGHRYAKRTFTYTAVFSLALIVLERMDLSRLIYQTDGDTGSAILAAIAGGLINGALYSLCVKVEGSTGGTDIIGALVNHKYPEYNTVWIIFPSTLPWQ